MDNWTKTVIMVGDAPVKAYINTERTEAVLFYSFGRYSRLGCYNSPGVDVLDMTVDFLLGSENNVVSFSSYVNSLEDTVSIQIDKITG